MTPAFAVLLAAAAGCSTPAIPRYEPPAPIVAPAELEPPPIADVGWPPTGCPCNAEGTSFGDFCCYIFSDGFWTGDTSRWDVVVGEEPEP